MNPNRFYIYIHTVKEEFEIDGKVYPVGAVVYVGSGSGGRFNNIKDRSDTHKVFWDKLNKVIIQSGIDFENKIRIENEWIETYWDTGYLFNKVRVNRPVKDLDYDLFCEYLYVDESSPSGLRWKKKVRYDLPVGSVAGRFRHDKDGYWYVKLRQKMYIAQRVVMTMAQGYPVPNDMLVNHKDGNRSNNSVENLEVVTFSENCRKKTNKKISSTGIEHLHWSVQHGYWVVKFNLNFKLFSKVFSVKRFAKENGLSFEEAKEIKKKEALAYLEQLKTEQGY